MASRIGSSPRVRGRQDENGDDFRAAGLIPAGAGQTDVAGVSFRAGRAHPRGCGADPVPKSATGWTRGSSPRVRGRRRDRSTRLQLMRLIPAGAGQTSASGVARPVSGAHPRGCGADQMQDPDVQADWGSSPRVRGRLLPAGERRARFRLIPAGAGQTASSPCPGPESWAHPRGCGADPRLGPIRTRSPGSSPRVRGRHAAADGAVFGAGLIPAGAGQTRVQVGIFDLDGAHPRGCGADPRRIFARLGGWGSSPRVRGRPARRVHAGYADGLIPAGAGQTGVHHPDECRNRAHPRGCGADAFSSKRTFWCSGSSPRVRGRLGVHPPERRPDGLIPAGAGQTFVYSALHSHRWAHPRGCGADGLSGRSTGCLRGSSPRVRGRLRGLGAYGPWPPAHPRGCGADWFRSRPRRVSFGSSPRVRGRQHHQRQ